MHIMQNMTAASDQSCLKSTPRGLMPSLGAHRRASLQHNIHTCNSQRGLGCSLGLMYACNKSQAVRCGAWCPA
jgi:hypothetical protein